LIEFVFPTAAATRVTAVITLWVVGSVIVAAAFAAILPPEVAIRGALATGCVLFGVVATLGYLVSR